MNLKRKVVITGGAGYIGSLLSKEAVDAGYEVHVVDRFFFGNQDLDRYGVVLHKMDTRDLDPHVIEGAYAVLDLAAISNDPAGELNKEITLGINFEARKGLQALCNQLGVERYVLASSCSVYGFQDGVVNEQSELNPLTTYAKANILAEEAAFSQSNGQTVFTALRQATVFGLSPRMRFDLAVNAMALNLWKSGKLRILRDGTQWRPMVHVRDASRAFLKVIDAKSEQVSNQVFNVGANSQNFQILEIANKVASALGIELELEWYGDPDSRSYQVDFSKIASKLDYKCEHSVEGATVEIVAALERGEIEETERTKTVNWYQSLANWDAVLNEVKLEGRIL
jgi:nucleoside-diphosphate-sugar epimerase